MQFNDCLESCFNADVSSVHVRENLVTHVIQRIEREIEQYQMCRDIFGTHEYGPENCQDAWSDAGFFTEEMTMHQAVHHAKKRIAGVERKQAQAA